MNSPNSHSRRKSSLRLAQPPPIPVPPSLRTSPYLNCPVFKKETTSPRLPTEEEERWLQDTVPADVRPNSAAPTVGPSSPRDRIPCLARHTTFPTSHLSPPPSVNPNSMSAHFRPRSGTVKHRDHIGPETLTNQPAAMPASHSDPSRLDPYHTPSLLISGSGAGSSLQLTPDGLGWSSIGARSSSSTGSRTPSEPQFARLGVGDQGYFSKSRSVSRS